MDHLSQKTGIEVFEGHKAETLFKSIAGVAVTSNYSFALWKNPVSEEINCLVDISPEPKWCRPEIESMNPGFIFSPFQNNDNERVLFLEADMHFRWKPGSRWHLNDGMNYEKSRKADEFLERVHQAIRENDLFQPACFTVPGSIPRDSGKAHYIQMIRNSISAIKSGTFDKVVPSRRKIIKFRKPADPVHAFLSIGRTYPNSFVSLTSTPVTGTWIGASPEVLISVENNEIFQTASVAGTQSFKPRVKLSEVTWTQKEIEEQALVSRYIINCFKKIRLREFSENGPKTVKAGNLLHLKTLFSVNLTETNFPLLGSVMLKLLHPTSAVCGMPRQQALDFLQEEENYDRQYYSGYLGPVRIDHKTGLYVNIRCGRIQQDHAVFFAGAGVTIDSIPHKEWKETEVKIQSIARFFK